MKKYAYYLPQFHCIPENNEWWGKGFTEWTNVKKAKSLFNNHRQPKTPYKCNYYSLEDKNTLVWQSQLMNDYKVEGMIFYHYYFSGKKLLEKPAEMLLNSPEIPMHFFFCWANHSWFRSWEGSKELLIDQTYGEIEEWEKHFQYLLPFFMDARYEKKDNKPLFMIFNHDFAQKNDILEYFNRRCIDFGFSGMCAIEMCNKYNTREIENVFANSSSCTDFVHLREPGTACNYFRNDRKNIMFRIYNKIGKLSHNLRSNYVEKYNGDNLFKVMTSQKNRNHKIIRGLFFEWDNTPRHGYRGFIITPPSKQNFMKYMNSIKDDEYVFINAWNEWCEGMMLEPTEENKYKYLEWIKEWSEKNEDRINGI